MTEAGLRAFEARDRSAAARYSYENRPADLPEPMLKQLRANADAFRYWQGRSPSYRRGAAYCVTSAKQESTRLRRLQQLIDDSAAGLDVKPLRTDRAG